MIKFILNTFKSIKTPNLVRVTIGLVLFAGFLITGHTSTAKTAPRCQFVLYAYNKKLPKVVEIMYGQMPIFDAEANCFNAVMMWHEDPSRTPYHGIDNANEFSAFLQNNFREIPRSLAKQGDVIAFYDTFEPSKSRISRWLWGDRPDEVIHGAIYFDSKNVWQKLSASDKHGWDVMSLKKTVDYYGGAEKIKLRYFRRLDE